MDGDSHDEGLRTDLPVLLRRRQLFGLAGGISVAGVLAACGLGSEEPQPLGTTSQAPSASPTTSGLGAATPEPGPPRSRRCPTRLPGPSRATDPTGRTCWTTAGSCALDIRSSFGTSTTVATGVPLTIRLTVRDAATGDALTGAAVYVWHCDSEGSYSIYGSGLEDENYLRGVQPVDGRHRHLHVDLSRLLLGPLAAHPLRGVSKRHGERSNPDRS